MPALDDITVLDFTHHVSGPACTAMLGDLGATVIKVEPLDVGEASRYAGTHLVAEDMWPTNFFVHNRNKKSVAIDLKTEAGRAVARDLAISADVIVENFRPGVMERLGLGYETLTAENPRLIYCAISGFGPAGPYRDKAALDIVLQAMGGLMSLTGEVGGSPVPAGAPVGDTASGIYAAVGVLAALHERSRSGQGQRVDVPMLDCVAALMAARFQQFFATGVDLEPLGAGHPQACPWQTFAASDGLFVLAVNTDGFWQRLCRAIGRDDLADDPRYAKNADRVRLRADISATLSAEFAVRPREYWTQLLDAAGVPNGPVFRLSETAEDPQAIFNNTFPEIQVGSARIRTVRNPLRMSATPEPPLNPPAELGSDTISTLKGIGFTHDQVAELIATRAIAGGGEQA